MKMAVIPSKSQFLSVIFCFIFFLLFSQHSSNARTLTLRRNSFNNLQIKKCNIDKIYNLGDSLSDTGNLVTESPLDKGRFFNNFPYGITLGKPTGRCSNGLLMIDYFASAFGLPYLKPYERVEGADFKHGVNFAVAGATALPVDYLKARGIPQTFVATSSSLGVQLQWMSSYFNYLCPNGECHDKLKNSLFFVGEIGGNDYNYPLVGNNGSVPLNDWITMVLQPMIPEVIQSITEAVETVIGFGATKIIVPGNFPIGCLPVYLSHYQTNDTTAFDSNQCLVELNNFATLHNDILKAAIEQLKKDYPNTAIVYTDYYNAFLSLLSGAQEFGFEDKLSACCGSGVSHNFDLRSLCGMPNVTTSCPNPDNHISWDGIHMTQQAYKVMADYLIKSIFPQLQCS